jgi:hypothetical protein
MHREARTPTFSATMYMNVNREKAIIATRFGTPTSMMKARCMAVGRELVEREVRKDGQQVNEGPGGTDFLSCKFRL